jgi:hypothetical protein
MCVKAGGWVERLCCEKMYIKVHFAIDAGTKELVTVEITADDTHDPDALPPLIMDSPRAVGLLMGYTWMVDHHIRHSNAGLESTHLKPCQI